MVTFSHADEAKKTLMLTNGEAVLDTAFVSIMPKGKLDHSDMDRSYFVRKLQNDSRVVEYSKELREAKEGLREFERSIDSEMPNLQRLKEFKSLAQEMIENPAGRTRRNPS